jgi:hypothetical protein
MLIAHGEQAFAIPNHRQLRASSLARWRFVRNAVKMCSFPLVRAEVFLTGGICFCVYHIQQLWRQNKLWPNYRVIATERGAPPVANGEPGTGVNAPVC